MGLADIGLVLAQVASWRRGKQKGARKVIYRRICRGQKSTADRSIQESFFKDTAPERSFA